MGFNVAASLALAIVYVLTIPPILDSIERKIRAKLQTRYGPPTIIQTWLDILKLMSKELRVPQGSELSYALLLTLFILGVASSAVLSFIIASKVADALSIALALVFLASLHTVSIISSAITANPFALVGLFRSIVLSIINEVGYFISIVIALTSSALIALNLNAKTFLLLSIAALAVLISTYVACGRLPYDIHEAEPELASGTLIEFSGPALALYIYTHLVERYLLMLLAIHSLFYSIAIQLPYLLSTLLTLVLASLLYLVYGAIAPLLGRTRIDLGVKFLTASYVTTLTMWVILWSV